MPIRANNTNKLLATSQKRKAASTLNPLFFFFTLVTGPRRSLSLKLRDTRVYEPQIRARLGTTAHFREVVNRTQVARGAHSPSMAHTVTVPGRQVQTLNPKL